MLRERGRMAAQGGGGGKLMALTALLRSNLRSSDVRIVFECYQVPAL
jgi:hypothetical protein